MKVHKSLRIDEENMNKIILRAAYENRNVSNFVNKELESANNAFCSIFSNQIKESGIDFSNKPTKEEIKRFKELMVEYHKANNPNNVRQ